MLNAISIVVYSIILSFAKTLLAEDSLNGTNSNKNNVHNQINPVNTTIKGNQTLSGNGTSSTSAAVVHSWGQNPESPMENMEITSDALVRGFIVFTGLGIIVIIYLAVKTMRANEPPDPNSTVRLYGVVAKRSDVEMRPLPLNDDDDDIDDMIFDRAAIKQPSDS